LPSENKEYLNKLKIIKLFEKNLNNTFNNKDIINFKKLIDSLSLFTK